MRRYVIKIPTTVQILKCDTRQILFIKGLISKKVLKLPLKILFLKNKNLILVTDISFKPNISKKLIKSLRGTSVALIKKTFLEVSTITYKKLKLIGVGYKAFLITASKLNLINFKLGLSHDIFLKVSENVSVKCHKSDKLFLSSNCYDLVTQTASFIRKLKSPEPYKGKGISYTNEVIKLKEGKKV